MRSTVKLKLLGLAVALAASASLVAVASRTTNAYFSDTISGTMTGTLGSGTAACPYRLALGTSKACQWDVKHCQPQRPLSIAQYDSKGAMFLNFGDQVRNESDAFSDVFRIVSLVPDDRLVTFKVTGTIAMLVGDVHLTNSKSTVLKAGTTQSVYVKISVPARVTPGNYTGTLTVQVSGWTGNSQLPMAVTVRSNAPKERCPYYFEAGRCTTGRSKPSGNRQDSLAAVATYDSTGAMLLDLGPQKRRTSKAFHDIFRLVSLVGVPRVVSFGVSGAIAPFVRQVSFDNLQRAVLAGLAVQPAGIRIHIPAQTRAGTYSGTLTVRLRGWPEVARVQVTLTVRGSGSRTGTAVSLEATPSARPTVAPTPPTPSATPAPTETPTPTSAPAPTPSGGVNGV